MSSSLSMLTRSTGKEVEWPTVSLPQWMVLQAVTICVGFPEFMYLTLMPPLLKMFWTDLPFLSLFLLFASRKWVVNPVLGCLEKCVYVENCKARRIERIRINKRQHLEEFLRIHLSLWKLKKRFRNEISGSWQAQWRDLANELSLSNEL